MTATMSETVRDMYDDQGRVDARRIADALGVKKAAIARAFGSKPDTVRHNPVTEEIQKTGHRFLDMLDELVRLFNNDRKSALIWMRKPHPALEDASPLEAISEGDLDVVEHLVHAIATGQPS